MQNTFLAWLKGFQPLPVSTDWRERSRACCGALLGILLTALLSRWLLPASAMPWLIAPMGASSVLLFAAPSSPLAQPWSIVGGNLLAALVGVACARWIGDPAWAAAVAVSLAIGLMLATRCLHPPSGAVALTAVLGGPAIHDLGFSFIWMPVTVNSLLLLLVALAFNNLTRHQYPNAHSAPANADSDRRALARLGFTSADLDRAIARYDEVLDISRDDLEMILRQTEMEAWQRRFGEIRCSDIMSRNLISVEFGTHLDEAWRLLHKHRIKAMPVVDWSGRLIGIITVADFLRHAGPGSFSRLEDRLQGLIRRTVGMESSKPEVVGQIMSAEVDSVQPQQPIVDLVPILSGTGHHHLPVIDYDRRLLGMVTQSDLVLGLYRHQIDQATGGARSG